MQKIFLYLFLYFAVFFSSFSVSLAAETCSYQAKIDECTGAFERFRGGNISSSIVQGGRIKTITDFPCIQAGPEMRTFQIIMDEKFSKIDEQMQEFLSDLYTSKDFYFATWGQFDALDAAGQIEKISDDFKKAMEDSCQETTRETAACFWKELTVDAAKDFIAGWNGACYRLAKTKAGIFKNIAVNGLLLNAAAIEKDDKKRYNKQQRTKYNKVLDLMMLHLSYIERMWKKTTSFTKHPL